MDSEHLAERLHSRLLGIIERAGHAVQWVGFDEETGAPPFAYTVGLSAQSRHGYELALSGLRPETATGALNNLASILARGDAAPRPGVDIGEVMAGYPVRLRTVEDPTGFTFIRAIYGEVPTVWQLVWPDREGRFPGEPGCALPRDAQHLL